MSADLRAFANPNQVDPARIAEALADLWREADDDGGVGTTRACGLTLIAAVSGDLEFARAATLIAQATAVVPARTLLVDLDPATDGDLTAEVSALCSLDKNAGKTVCQEQVLVKAAPSRFADVAPLISPLLVADLPVVLYVPEPRLLDLAPVKNLLHALDALVIDSSAAPDARSLLGKMLDLHARGRFAVRDLTFERLRPWRTSIAEGFDALASQGRALRAVVVEAANGDAHGEILIGWVEQRLDAAAGIQRTSVATELRVAATARGGSDGLRVSLESRGPAPMVVTYRRENGHVRRVDERGATGSSAGCLQMPSDADALTHVLCDPRTDRESMAALETLFKRRGAQ